MDTGGAHPVMEIYNPGSEIRLKRKLTAEPLKYCENQEMNIALTEANYLFGHTRAISTNNLPTFLVSSDPGCVRCVSYFHGMSTVGFKETELRCR